jgi:succinyl-CoA synthetase beta subunit
VQALTEHVLKARLAERGARVPRGRVATTADEAREAAAELGGRAVVKSMVPRKDRAVAGLVRLVASADEAATAACEMLSTEPGFPLLVEEIAAAGEEHYLAMGFDLLAGAAVVMHGPGGSGVEKRSTPPTQTLAALGGTVPAGAVPPELASLAQAMFEEFQHLKAHVLEVNPVRVVDGEAWVLDAKAVLDPAAATPEEAVEIGVPDPVEVRLQAEAASLRGGTEVRFGCLDGDVGIVSAGGGVLTLLNDALVDHDLRPANFADVSGGSATTRILGSVAREVVGLDPRGVLVMTGITSSVTVVEFARTIREALTPLADREPQVPVVARMAGTGEEEAVTILGDLPRCRVVGKDTTVEECVALLAELLAEDVTT